MKTTTTTTTTRPIFPVPPAPSITTPRLILRPYAHADAPAMFVVRSQPEVMRWTSQKVADADIEQTVAWMARAFVSENFLFVIEERGDHGGGGGVGGSLIGLIGATPGLPPGVGYLFRKEMWGKGYATEALRAWLRAYWGLKRRKVVVVVDDDDDDEGGADTVTKAGGTEEQAVAGGDVGEDMEREETLLADTDVANAASQNVLRKCGFEELGPFRKNGVELVGYIYRRP